MKCVTSFFLATFIASMSTGCGLADAEKTDTLRLEKTVRHAFERDLCLAHPMDGKYELLEIVVVPVEIENAYQECPDAVLEILLPIAENGTPYESVKAIAYARALVEDPAIASVVVRLSNTETYDEVDENWDKSPRQHWLGKLKTRIALAKASDSRP